MTIQRITATWYKATVHGLVFWAPSRGEVKAKARGYLASSDAFQR